ncbi:hypothetical protein CLHOM_17680 [Clostridium homopropionicum DSM 5847]|uniref:Spore coat protein n=1 Tax=Clostridium homopropionicum DSM 5847 TaxID=1121318 RepID=A0A0L6Z9N5_9CLOT|nr:hypothetical protein [Clostridium homopropionicum]KOA19679.1 hypothetical protein CLHOM_17680 [Clostridium homopropionicum DSM 5847]SFF80225.1 hypothetical protein SAMN04488501_102226 [Clostridium homopropionicum]
MDNKMNLAPHEMLELRELMDSNLIGAKKIQSSISMIEDSELQSFAERCLHTKKENIKAMESFIQNKLNM